MKTTTENTDRILEYADFKDLHDKQFFVHFNQENAISSRLVELKLLGKSNIEEFRDSFSLVFALNLSGEYYSQGTYRVVNDELGAFELFMVPIGREGATILYQAIFN